MTATIKFGDIETELTRWGGDVPMPHRYRYEAYYNACVHQLRQQLGSNPHLDLVCIFEKEARLYDGFGKTWAFHSVILGLAAFAQAAVALTAPVAVDLSVLAVGSMLTGGVCYGLNRMRLQCVRRLESLRMEAKNYYGLQPEFTKLALAYVLTTAEHVLWTMAFGQQPLPDLSKARRKLTQQIEKGQIDLWPVRHANLPPVRGHRRALDHSSLTR